MEIKLRDDLDQFVRGKLAQYDIPATDLARGLLSIALQAQIEEPRGTWRGKPEDSILDSAGKVADAVLVDPELRQEIRIQSKVRFNTLLHALVRHGSPAFPSKPND